MYAIVDIAGQQFKVSKGQEIFVHQLENEAGSQVEFDQVLLIDKEGKVNVGQPVIPGAMVMAKVIEHLKGDKILVFHKKRRKGYRKLNGHRQFFSKIHIENILESGAKKTKKAAPQVKKTTPEKPTPKPAPKDKPEVKAEVKTPAAPKPKAKPKKEVETKPRAKATTQSKPKKAAPKKKVEEKKTEVKKSAKPKAEQTKKTPAKAEKAAEKPKAKKSEE